MTKKVEKNTEENEIILEEIIKERIEENKNLFSKQELEVAKNNISLIKKMYLLGMINGKEIYSSKPSE